MTYPIILAHGVCRFDKIWSEAFAIDNCDDVKKDRWHYFKGIRTMLKANGYRVFHSSVAWGARVEKRAADLKRNIQTILHDTGESKINIIAHSMGGLDTRHMMYNDRHHDTIHHHIASLTTISTPHWGSPFADWGLANLQPLITVANKIGLDVEAFKDLTVTACRAFNTNPEVQDFEHTCEDRIVFQTYAGRQSFWSVCDALKIPYYIIEKEEGENDGLVSVTSAKWRDDYFKGCIENADHINELGWWDTAQIWMRENEDELLARIHRFYADIAAQLP